MREISILAFSLLTIVCWGTFGPLLHRGQIAFGSAGQLDWHRALICVGIAFGLIAVLNHLHRDRSENATQRAGTGMVWSFAAGLTGAAGAGAIVLAFRWDGHPLFVMPLVFALAPLVATIWFMAVRGAFFKLSLWLYLGIAVVVIGCVGVFFFQPLAGSGQAQWWPLAAAVGFAVLCWGSFVPLLQRSQIHAGSRQLGPLLSVGLAYLVAAVLVPWWVSGVWHADDAGNWNVSGCGWSLAAGTAGGFGAVGVLWVFRTVGTSTWLMPLVFGGAPIVNTLVTTRLNDLQGQLGWPFFGSLFLLIAGSITVLACAPSTAKPTAPPPIVLSSGNKS